MTQVRQAPFLQPWNQALEDYYRYDCQEVPGGIMASTSLATTAEDRASLNQVDLSLLYPQVECPVLALRAGQGIMSPSQLVMPPDATARLREDLPQTQLVDLAECNHFSIVFQPSAQRQQAIKQFLDSLP